MTRIRIPDRRRDRSASEAGPGGREASALAWSLSLMLCLWAAPRSLPAQSLGDAARRQAETRAERTERSPDRSRVFTDADLAAARADEPPAKNVAVRTEAASVPDLASEVSDEGRDAFAEQLERERENRREQEARWKALAATARRRVELAQEAYDSACGASIVVSGSGGG